MDINELEQLIESKLSPIEEILDKIQIEVNLIKKTLIEIDDTLYRIEKYALMVER